MYNKANTVLWMTEQNFAKPRQQVLYPHIGLYV